LAENLIASLSEIQQLDGLPCLDALWLNGNPLAVMADYRESTLALFTYV